MTGDRDQRLRGGTERLQPRIQTLRRLLRPDLSPEELEQTEADLTLASEVQPTRMLARRARDAQPRSTVTGLLTGGGVLPYKSEAEQAMAGLLSAVKSKAKTEAKPLKFASFGAFYAKFSELGLFSQEMLADHPEDYWEADWLLKTTLYLLGEYDWATAELYCSEVLRRWDRIDRQQYVLSPDFKEGDYEACCHMPALHAAIFSVRKQRRSQASGADSTQKSYCSFCKKSFTIKPNEPAHIAKTCNKKKTAEAKAADADGGKGGKTPG